MSYKKATIFRLETFETRIRSSKAIFVVAILILASSCSVAEPLPEITHGTDSSSNFDWHVVNNFRPFSSYDFASNIVRENGFYVNRDENKREVDESKMFEYFGQVSLYKNIITDDGFVANTKIELPSRNHFEEINNRYQFFYGDFKQEYEVTESYTPVNKYLVRVHSGIEGNCEWEIHDRSLNQKQNTMSSCREIFVIVGEDGASLNISNLSDSTKTVFDIKPEEKTVLALGDSYISGEGLGDWVDLKCHRSFYSWPYLVTAALAENDRKNTYTIISRACSGAETAALTSEYEGIMAAPSTITRVDSGGQFVPGRQGPRYKNAQINQALADLCDVELINASDCNVSPAYLFLSIGGNDAGFVVVK